MRYDKMDNLRLLLIFTVVFGHMLKMVPGWLAAWIYKAIYCFHMPAFLFVGGYFARFNREKWYRRLLLPYLCFQTLYLLFDYFVLGHKAGEPFILQFTSPYWIMWYLLVFTAYHAFLPLLPEPSPNGPGRRDFLTILVMVAVALITGFDDTIGRYLSLSRILVFAPFFYAGYYLSGWRPFPPIPRKGIVFAVCAVLVAAGTAYAIRRPIPISLLLEYWDYEKCNATPILRLIHMIIASAWIILLLIVVPNRRIPVLTTLGQNTMPIYLLHGFILRLIRAQKIFQYRVSVNLTIAFAITCLVIVALGNPWLGKAFKKVF